MSQTQVLPDRPSTLIFECIRGEKETRKSKSYELNWTQSRDEFIVELKRGIDTWVGRENRSPDRCYAIIEFWSRDKDIILGNISQKQIRIPLGRLGQSAGDFLIEVLSSSDINLFSVQSRGTVKTNTKLCL